MRLTYDRETRVLSVEDDRGETTTIVADNRQAVVMTSLILAVLDEARRIAARQPSPPSSPRAHGCTPSEFDRLLARRRGRAGI